MKRRRALLITYMWPPMEGVGILRVMKFAKYLPYYGWDPVILTIKSGLNDNNVCDKVKVFRTGYVNILEKFKKFLLPGSSKPVKDKMPPVGKVPGSKKFSLARELVSIPDDQIGWYGFAVNEGRSIIGKEEIDLIFSTSPPETAHLIGKRLKEISGLPWVADLRDLWSEDHFRYRPFLKKILLKFIERNVLSRADNIITVSRPWADKIRSSLNCDNKKITVIENGFDEEDFAGIPSSKNQKFTISYTGKIHKYYQPLDIFFKALRGIIRDGLIDKNSIEVNFYIMGYDKPDVRALADKYGVAEFVSEFGKVDYPASLKIQKQSDALLFIQWFGEGGDGWYSAKLYDYIGSARPIIALLNPDSKSVAGDLIRKTASGLIAYDENSMKEAILKLYEKFLGKRESPAPEENESLHLTRRFKARELADIFNSVIS